MKNDVLFDIETSNDMGQHGTQTTIAALRSAYISSRRGVVLLQKSTSKSSKTQPKNDKMSKRCKSAVFSRWHLWRLILN